MPDGPELDPEERRLLPAVVLPVPHLRVVDERAASSSDPVEDLARFLDLPDTGPGRFHTGVRASAARHPAGGAGQVGLPAEPPEHPRLAVLGSALVGDATRTTAAVTLCLDREEYVGTAGGASDDGTVQRTVARATARAVCTALRDQGRLDIGDVVIAVLGDDRVAVVQVCWVGPWGGERLTGIAAVADDVHAAVIRATLDAVNRRLSPELAR